MNIKWSQLIIAFLLSLLWSQIIWADEVREVYTGSRPLGMVYQMTTMRSCTTQQGF